MDALRQAYVEAYSEEWAQGLQDNIPPHMAGGVARYIVHGIRPGKFLQAVISGDLFGAAACADDMNRTCLRNYCNFFHNFSPSDCYGSAEKMEQWIEKRSEKEEE